MSDARKTLLRFAATGSVDDGKSTLLGRLLYETRSIYEDQYEAVVRTSRRRGLEQADLAWLLDGLSAERQQGITIDVAYRYFETPKRKYIIIDTPGHVQYTRNMVTGASQADCAIILIDARNGVLTQSKRHGFLLSLLQIPHLIVAVNKMDLVGYSRDIYESIVADYENYSQKLDISDITFIPVSALKGDNVVNKSDNMPWYQGVTLLHSLENVHASADRNLVDFRFPVQYVLRPHMDFRGYAGKIASGTITPGEEVVILPSQIITKVKSVITCDGELQEAFAGQSVSLTLADEIDVSRGDMIVRKNNLPHAGTTLEATICWMDDAPLSLSSTYLLKHTTRSVRALVSSITYKIDVNTLHRNPADSLELNDIGRVEIQTASPIFFDSYKINHATGSFILIDLKTNNTVAAGIIRGTSCKIKEPATDAQRKDSVLQSPHTAWSSGNIPRDVREQRNRHRAAVLWFTGFSGSGKSTIAKELESRLFAMGCQTMLLDGDHLRHGLCGDLNFSAGDRSENIRRAGETARLFFESGHIVLCSFISPFAKDRQSARSLFPEKRFFEIYVQCDIETCKKRDPRGLYQKALRGEISEFTGISSPYEAPVNSEITVDTDNQNKEEIFNLIVQRLIDEGIITACI